MSLSNLASGSSAGTDSVETTVRKRFQSAWVVVAMLVASLIIVKWHQKLPLFSAPGQDSLPFLVATDSEYYLAMAQEGPAKIPSPFSKRIMYPWLAGTISRLTGQPMGSVFLALNLTALLGLAFCVAELLRETVGQPLLALLFLLTPFPLECFELAYLPDLFHMALLALFFLALLRNKTRWALLVLFLAFLTRENTLLLFLFTSGLAWFRGRKRLSLEAGGVLGAGLASYFLICRVGLPNNHHLPDFLYQFLRVPFYLALNFFGIRVWSDFHPEQGTAFVTWHLPPWLKFGADNVVGLAYPNWRYPAETIIIWLTVFGLGPLILYYLLRRNGKTRSLPFAVELALWYGLACYLSGPLLGDWVDRLVGYGWPAFWIAMPCLWFACAPHVKPWPATLVAAGYLVACWWPRFFGYGNNRSVNPWPCFGVLVFYFLAGFKMRHITSKSCL